MTLLSFLTFIPSVILGLLSVNLIWTEKSPSSLPLKLSLGVGLGLGLSSMLHFVTLHIAPGKINPVLLQVILVIALSIVTYYKAGIPKFHNLRLPKLSWLQWGLFIAFVSSVIVSILVFVNYVISRPQGALDAWSIWNRAARFIHRDPENWIATLSPDIALLRHADYPLLIPLNVAWGWDVVGNETLRIPMMQSLLFTLATIFLMFSALAFFRTVGQASLASMILIAVSGVVSSGTYLIADVPVTYFIFASGLLMYLYTQRNELSLLALSGFMAGLAGWTKNEGLLFIAISPVALIISSPKNLKKAFIYYLSGLLLPLLVILYFKSIAPPNDLATNSLTDMLHQVMDPSRYGLILKSFLSTLQSREPILLFLYALFMWRDFNKDHLRGIFVLVVMFSLQVLGYGFIYLITPYDLEWHLLTSQSRLFMQIVPLTLFLCFVISADPETVFFERQEKLT